jgi:hypothetical protein
MRGAAPVVVPFRPRPSRRQAVTAALSAVAAGTTVFDSDERWAGRLRQTAAELGPVFAAFADYLATRVDLLRVADCRALAYTRTTSLVWPVGRVAQALGEEHGGRAVVDLADDPIVTTPVSQVHRGHLGGGEQVLVEMVTIDRSRMDADLELLPLMRCAVGKRISAAALESALADFRARFEDGCNCMRRLPLAIQAAELAAVDGRLRAPIPRPELCSPRVLVSELPSEADPRVEAQPAWHHRDPRLEVLAAWLRQATSGSVFPVPAAAIVREHDVVVIGSYARLSEGSGPHVIAYLLALAGHLPDRAWSALAHELSPAAGAAPAEDVAREFRSLVPFRDDRTCDSGSELADHAFLQWRVASRSGWLPSRQLVPFYQGLFAMLSAAGDGGGRDVFADAVRGLRFDSAVRGADEWASGFDMMTAVERQMLLLMQLPQKLDRLLSVAADGSVRVHLATDDRSGARRSRMAVTLALVLAAAAAIVLAGAAAPLTAAAPESRQALALLVAGGLFVWAVGRVL